MLPQDAYCVHLFDHKELGLLSLVAFADAEDQQEFLRVVSTFEQQNDAIHLCSMDLTSDLNYHLGNLMVGYSQRLLRRMKKRRAAFAQNALQEFIFSAIACGWNMSVGMLRASLITQGKLTHGDELLREWFEAGGDCRIVRGFRPVDVLAEALQTAEECRLNSCMVMTLLRKAIEFGYRSCQAYITGCA